jgi:hypothetical protein
MNTKRLITASRAGGAKSRNPIPQGKYASTPGGLRQCILLNTIALKREPSETVAKSSRQIVFLPNEPNLPVQERDESASPVAPKSAPRKVQTQPTGTRTTHPDRCPDRLTSILVECRMPSVLIGGLFNGCSYYTGGESKLST